MGEFSHIDNNGKAKMVDISEKGTTRRRAVAVASVSMEPKTLKMIKNREMEKGAVLETARIAAIMAVKRTHELIPMCHQILLTGIDVNFKFIDNTKLEITVIAKTTGKTGVEMEALNGVSIAALTVYDMCKAVDKKMVIGDIKLMEKTGGKSGKFIRE
ncbi:MAG TPA: cyclic pyranopterin monophosphate synthase MoaC [Halanaerobiales bacterium]|nr:cyclic pyranopterin monophosphate synthase MoaC [Halanaerobiales bacterium]